MSGHVADMLLMACFEMLGYLMRKIKFEAPPLILAWAARGSEPAGCHHCDGA
jgi:TctA family transporter